MGPTAQAAPTAFSYSLLVRLFLLLCACAAAQGFTLNEAVLLRYHLTLAQYQALSPGDQERVFEWIRLQEQKPQAPRPAARPPARPLAQTQLQAAPQESGAIFDGLTPKLELFGDGEVRRFSLTAPGGAVAEAGTLGLDRRSPLVAPSGYVGIGQDASGSGRLLDYDVRSRLYALDLGARLYTDDAPALDARIDQGVRSLRTLDPIWGVGASDVDSLQRNLAFSSSYERDWLLVGSALARAGRAYPLAPGVDVGWSAMGVMRMTGLFPNVTLDQTIGTRLGGHFGLFGGVTEAPGLFDRGVISDSLAAGKLRTDVHVDAAPHAEVAAWGQVPYLSGVQYQLSAGQQWNPWTTVRSVAASVGTPSVSAFGRYSDESGPDLEYDRRKAQAGVSVSPSAGVDVWAQYSREGAQFGTAQVDNQAVMVGLTVRDTAGPSQGASVTMESLFGGRDQLVSPDDQAFFAQLLQKALDGLRALKDAADAPGDWQKLQQAWNGLPPGVQSLLEQAWAQADPGAPPLKSIVGIKPADFATWGKLVDLLTDTKVLERLLVRYVRAQLVRKLDGVQIPVLGHMRLSPALVLAAAHSYALSLTPVPPATAKDQDVLDGLMLDKLSGAAGCKAGPQPRATTDCLLSVLPADQRASIEKAYGPGIDLVLKGAVDWPSGVLRRELDRLALQVVMAAETLDELSVDGGERIADLNVSGLRRSFERLDARSRRDESVVLKAAAKDLGDELAARDARVRADLAAYGQQRLDWLQAQPAWPANVRVAVRPEDWPELLGAYGDAKLFDFILKCKAKLAGRSGDARVLIELDRSPLQSLVVRRGPVETIALPARGMDLSLFDLEL